MKIVKSRLRKIITEELCSILAEQDTSQTRVASRPAQKAAIASRLAGAADDETQTIDMEAIIQKQIDDMAEPSLYRAEAERLFDLFFGGRNEYGIEMLTYMNDELDEIVAKLGGYQFPKLYKGDKQPSPIFVKVAQEFEKERIPIINNEDEFLSRVEDKVLAIAKRGFAQTGAGSEEDLTAVEKSKASQKKTAAETWATNQVIKVLNDEQPDKHGYLPTLDKATTEEIDQLVRLIPLSEPELYKQAYDFYMKKNS